MVKTCCFFGHGKIYGEAPGLSEALADAVEQHITEYGVTDFLVGHYQTYLGAPLVKAHGSLTPEDQAQIGDLCQPYLEWRQKQG